MGEHPHFVAVRLFNNPEGWVAQFTGEDIASRFPLWLTGCDAAVGGNWSGWSGRQYAVHARVEGVSGPAGLDGFTDGMLMGCLLYTSLHQAQGGGADEAEALCAEWLRAAPTPMRWSDGREVLLFACKPTDAASAP